MASIPGSKITDAARELIERIGPKLASRFSEELGLDLSTMSHADKDLALGVAKSLKGEGAGDESLITNVRNYLKNTDNPEYVPGATKAASEVAADVSPEAAKARLQEPPKVPADYVTEFPSGKEAAQGTGKGFSRRNPGDQRALPSGDQAETVGAPYDPDTTPPFHATTTIGKNPRTAADIRADLENPPSTNVRPSDAGYEEMTTALAPQRVGGDVEDAEFHNVYPGTGSTATQGRTAEDLAKEASAASTKRKAAAAVAATGVAGAGTAAYLNGDDAAPVAGEAKADDLEVTSGSKTAAKKPPPVTPSGKIDGPAFIMNFPAFVTKPYKGPAMPSDKIDQPTTVKIGDKQVDPLEYLAQAEQREITSINNLADAYKQERDGLKQRELFEGIVNAIGHLAAGWYGQHHGVDMSGTKFDVTDWVAQGEALRRHYDALTGMEKDKFAASEKTAMAGERQLQQRRTDEEQRWQRNAAIYNAAVNQYNHDRESDFQAWQVKIKGIELNNTIVHWNQEFKAQEDRIDAMLGRAKNTKDAKDAAAQLKQLNADKEAGRKVTTLVAQAANAKNSDAGMLLVNQAREINDDLASRGRNVLPPDAFVDKRAGNFLPLVGDDQPGLANASTVSKQAVKATNTDMQGGAPKAGATTDRPPVADAAKTSTPRTVSSAEVRAYAAAHPPLTPEAAATWLKSQGYTIGQ